MRLTNTKHVLIVGFSSIFILTVLVALLISEQMTQTLNSINYIVKDNNTKTNLISTMLVSARERTISLQRIVRLEDAFERDEEWLRFNSYATKFTVARKEFVALGLSAEESYILSQQSKLTNQVAPKQLQIAELALNDKLEEAEAMLSYDAILVQDLVLVQLYNLLSLLENESNKTVLDVSEQMRSTRQKLTSFIIMMLLGGTIISYIIIRRIGIAERKLSREKERAQVTLHSIGDAVISTDADGYIKYFNSAAEEITELTLRQVKDKKLNKVLKFSSEKNNKRINPLENLKVEKPHSSSDGHARLLVDNGIEYAIEYSCAPILSANKKLEGAVLVFRDVTEIRAMALQLGFQATHDELTGLINRREFENRVELALMSARGEGQHHVMCYLDLDQFKVVNDTCGHIAGDELLRQLAGLLKLEVRAGDTLARLGGDEFGVLYLNCSLDVAKRLAEKLRIMVNDFQFHWENKSFTVGVSIGLVSVDKHSNMHGLLSAADTACYVAKNEGRNRIHSFNDNDDALTQHAGQMQWVHIITKALEDGRFEVYCQRMKSFSEDYPEHFEMLIRMKDETGKIIPPNAFISAAERYNLMTWVDRWMVLHVFESIAALIKTTEKRNFIFAINISAQTLCDDDFLPYVKEQLKKYKLTASLICFEITETSAIINLTRAQILMKELKSLGCYFSLDDFGSGLSSFSYLKNLNVDFLKIDGAFVRDITSDPIDKALVESINQVGHVMGIKTIAEYVENQQILDIVEKMGIDFAQGYAIAKPVPVTEIKL